ncbi:MAG: Na+/H+ antiporter NhaC family protein [Candidatus Babeliales bacterium]|nr:Na+/H+ antiporter NhaC family protein [Candidatus Babeliales bacterium]
MNSFLVLLPPVLVLILSLATKNIVRSLFAGIIFSAFIATKFNLIKSGTIIYTNVYNQITDLSTIFFILLLLVLGTIIAFITKTGGAQALGNIIIKKSKTAKAAQTSCLLLSIALFIDDYLNTLTVGPVMRNLTDKFSIPRVKLAYLIGTMAGAIIIIAPISSWLGVLVGQLETSGISFTGQPLVLEDPFFAYLSTIPFIFYSFIIIASNFFIVKKGISYGPMHTFELNALNTENLGEDKPLEKTVENEKASSPSLIDFVTPIFSFIIALLIGLPFSGGFYLFGGQHSFIASLKNADSSLVLLISSIFSLILSLISGLIRKKLSASDILTLTKEGTVMMLPSVITILLAWLFGAFLRNDLHTGDYLANLVLGNLNITLIPCMIFLTSVAIALSIGSTWGTMAIMAPITIPMILSFKNITTLPTAIINIPILYACLGAIFSGATAGNHLSPISDSTIMASASAGAHITDYIKARTLYLIPSIIGAIIAYLICGFLIEKSFYIAALTSILSGIAVSFAIMLIFNKILKK